MSDPVQIALISAIPPTLAVCVAWWRIRKGVKEVHTLFNSRLDEWKQDWKKATADAIVAAKAEGVKEEKERQK